MENGVGPGAHPSNDSRARAHDALRAVALAEGSVSERVIVALPHAPRFAATNTFGGAVTVDVAPPAQAAAHFADALEQGSRAALIATASTLASSRDVLRAIRARRIGTVAHAIAEPGEGVALADLGWGLLFAGSVEESLDLTLIARRAAEDSGTPFVVVHERSALHHVESVAAPSRELCEAFLGSPVARVRRPSEAAHPVHARVSERAFAERVPFALGSAMRELESLTGRRRDVLERFPASDTQVVLLALGALGDAAIAEVERLRAQGHDVGAIKITALRPMSAPRLVKAAARSLAVAVLELADEPLAPSNALARDVKAAFADAITWAPDYPGIGRVPRVVSVVVGAEGFESGDVDAIVQASLAGEHGKRSFVLGGGSAADGLERPHLPRAASSHPLSARAYVHDRATAEACAELCAAVASSALGLHARSQVRALRGDEGTGFAVDVSAARDRPRASHAPHAVRLVAIEDIGALADGHPLLRLAHGGTLAVPTSHRAADAVWSELPAYAKAIVFDRGARVLGWHAVEASAAPGARRWAVAGSIAGLALAAAAGRGGLDASLVAREVSEAVSALTGDGTSAKLAADSARASFESHVEVPRLTVERDEEAIRLGRRDARAAVAR